MYSLIENEMSKTLLRKRLWIVLAILLILTVLFAYGEQYRAERTEERLIRRLGEDQVIDQTSLLSQQIADVKRQLDNPYIPEQRRATLAVQIEQLEYYLERGINPLTPSAAGFTKTYMEHLVSLFLPLLIIILACDLVSGEFTEGSIKLLLTTPVTRWKVLLSKYIALLIMTTIVVVATGVFSIVVSTYYFGFNGFTTPITTGFKIIEGSLDTSFVQNIPQWQYIILVYGLSWFVAISIATITFLVSVIVKSSAVAMGVMMSMLIGGAFLGFFMSDWPLVKYLFMVNMKLPDYLSGSMQPIEGITLGFSVLILALWTLASLILSFLIFNNQDVLV